MSDTTAGAESADSAAETADAEAAKANASTQPEGETAEGTTTEESTSTDTDWKSHARTWEDRAKASAKELAAERAELEKFREAQMTESEKERKAAVKEAESRVHGEYRSKLARANIVAAAAGDFAHPEDAPRYFDDLASVDPEDGEAIKTELAKILETRPELAGAPAKTKGSADGGVKTEDAVDLGSLSMDDYVEQRKKRQSA